MQLNIPPNKPYSESCDQNSDAILSVIQPLLSECENLLEIGSGTGQHAVFFARNMPSITWHTSDCAPYLSGIKMWLNDAGLDNTRHPVELDVSHSKWPKTNVDAIFTANSVHIMSWQNVEALFKGVGDLLETGGLFIVYGPFNYDNAYTSESNQRFDGWLKSRDPQSGIRNYEDICELAVNADLSFVEDNAMPANNRILVWEKVA